MFYLYGILSSIKRTPLEEILDIQATEDDMPRMVDLCERLGIENPIICSSINKIGFRMSGSIEEYEEYLRSDKKFRPIAMQCLAAGALKPQEAMEYVCQFPKIESVLFGASSRAHIQQNKELIETLSAQALAK